MKKILIVVVVVLIVIASLWKGYYFFYKQVRVYNFSKVSVSTEINFPIKTAYDAAVYAKQSDKYSLEGATQNVAALDDETRWEIRTKRYMQGKGKAGNWSILIISKGILPSYSCRLEFQSDGVWTLWGKCAWNK